MQFDESKHKRDKDGKFTNKNGSGKSEEERLTELVKKYSSNPDDDLKKLGKSKKKSRRVNYGHPKAVTSAVFDRISTVRSELDRYGQSKIKVNVNDYTYTVLLWGEDRDFDYMILGKRRIK